MFHFCFPHTEILHTRYTLNMHTHRARTHTARCAADVGRMFKQVSPVLSYLLLPKQERGSDKHMPVLPHQLSHTLSRTCTAIYAQSGCLSSTYCSSCCRLLKHAAHVLLACIYSSSAGASCLLKLPMRTALLLPSGRPVYGSMLSLCWVSLRGLVQALHAAISLNFASQCRLSSQLVRSSPGLGCRASLAA